MTEDKLKAIEADAEAFSAAYARDVSKLAAEVRRLRDLIAVTVNDRGHADCQWCNGDPTDGRDFPQRRHDHACPAFAPDGSVR